MALTQYQKKELEWNRKYYGAAVGGVIVKVEVKADEYGDLWPTLTVRQGEHLLELEVSQDQEGNGPGFLFGLPLPE